MTARRQQPPYSPILHSSGFFQQGLHSGGLKGTFLMLLPLEDGASHQNRHRPTLRKEGLTALGGEPGLWIV